jgi:hypothetical protein
MTRIFLLFLLSSACMLQAQVNYNANTKVTPYNGKFRMGINMGYYPGWDNKTLANIAAGNPALGLKGIGARSNRTGLAELVLDYYGYGLVEPDMAHWQSLGMGEFTAILGGPSPTHQDYSQHCPGQFSSMFANLYTPTWDGGLNGTPYNDNNYWAAYVYKAVSQYKDQVRFWEIWNEPGFDFTGNLGWRDDQYPGNWWKEGPNPCDYILRAPIYHYIRTLRIAYDVIKTVDPDGYVCLGSVGYQSLLNAILSNTDNPSMGDISADYPLTGGAYFDCISFHSYPHFDGSTTNFGLNIFRRHSDAAADGLDYYRGYYQEILDKYGYNGVTFPKKEWIVTEINSPRKAYSGPFFGGKDAQINHIMKAFMVGKINKFNQLHTFQLADQRTEADANYEFHQMGLYQKIDGSSPYNVTVNDEGKALKTMTDLVYDTEYDPVQTAAMNLPAGVRGYAWKRPNGRYVYAIWARTTVDLSESAAGTYSFPTSFNLNNVVKYTWDYGYSGTTQTVSSQNIALDARPVFFTTDAPITPTCTLSATASAAICNDNGTASNPADDTYTFDLTVSGANTSGNWTTFVGGKTYTGAIGTAQKIGPFSIAQGGITFVVRDPNKDGCQASVTVAAPATCSNGGTTTSGPYCASKGDFPWHDWIAGVKTGGMDNTSGKSQYSDFTAQTATFAPGSSNAITLTAGFSWFTHAENWRVWIDLDRNGTFEASEVVFQGAQPAPADGTLSAPFNGTLVIPASATTGTTRMRVSMKRGAFADPCETFANGETEDYTVKIDPSATGGGGGGTTTNTTNCASKSDFPWHDWITRVQLANLDQQSQKAAYTQYSSSAALKPGSTYPISLTAGFSWFTYDEYWKVWIDYDRDGLFEEPSEVAFSGQLPKPVDGTLEASLSGVVSVPANVTAGVTKMRVSMKRGSFPTACETLPFGEVEDYNVSIETLLKPQTNHQQTAERTPKSYGLNLYPNPASRAVMLNLNEYAGLPAKVTVLDRLGRVLKTADLGSVAPLIFELSLEGIPSGHYFVELRVEGHAPVTKKLAVE